jgi:hypothetical protein
MKRTVLSAALLACVGMFSCDTEKPVDPKGLVDVVFEIDRDHEFEGSSATRLDVFSGGATRWTPGDEVIIVDYGEGSTGRVFSYTDHTAKSSGRFSGRLLAGQGVKTYYSYHVPDEADGFHETSMVLSLGRHDMVIYENSQIFNVVYGRHCAMVGVPVQFDAENTDPSRRPNIQFHHANSLIEASITSHPGDDRLWDMEFDKVEFRLTAGEGEYPFSTELKIDMTQIIPAPLYIPFIENEATKENTMFTWIAYDEVKTLGPDMLPTSTSIYGIPIFALPTTSNFNVIATVDFWLGDDHILKLEKIGTAQGLRLSGLNVIDFDDGDIVEP